MVAPVVDRLRDAVDGNERVLVVVAGPNGAGKSTFFECFLEPLGLRFVNADLIARAIEPEAPGTVAYEAAKIADAERRLLVSEGVSFCMETVFSDPVGDKIAFLKEAQSAGYVLFLIFIGIDSPELSIGRIIQRVAEGGHDVPDEKVYARFPRTLANLREALKFVDYAFLFDNSSCDEPYRLVASTIKGNLVRSAGLTPGWAGMLNPEKLC